MRFIVTGGAGFIGHNVVRMLEEQGHECLVIDSTTNYGFIHKAEVEYLINERKRRIRATVHHLDLRDHRDIENFFKTFALNCDGVVHLASFPRQKVVEKNPIWGADVMSSALVNLLELSRQFGVKRFTYVSSSMVYGDFASGVTEDAVCAPQGQYGIMKLMGEQLVKDYSKRNCFDYTVIRPSAVYGELDVEDRVVSKFILSALRGETLRVNGADECLDFTHVDDTARGIVQAILSDAAVNKTYNITRGQAYSLQSAAQMATIITGQGRLELRERDMSFPTRGALNISAAKQDFGYNPTVNIDDGFRRYANWFKDSAYWKLKL